jgi:hypothetical protein
MYWIILYRRYTQIRLLILGLAMPQVVSRRPLTEEFRVRALVNPCRICGGQSGTRTGFFTSSLVFPCHYHSTIVLHIYISPGGSTICPLVAAVQRCNLIPLKSINIYIYYSTLDRFQEHGLIIRRDISFKNAAT